MEQSRMRKCLLPWIVNNIERQISWSQLCINPNAIHLLEANQDKIDWFYLSHNPNAIHLLEANQDKISWSIPNIRKNVI